MSLTVSSLLSSTAGPTQIACSRYANPVLLDTNGLSGRVCQINLAPDIVDIEPCCNDGAEVRVQDNCTQYCEVDGNDFYSCISDLWDGGFIGGPCGTVNEDSSPSVTSSGIQRTSTSAAPTLSETTSPTESEGEAQESEGPVEIEEGAAASVFGQRLFVLVTVAVVSTMGLVAWL